MQVKNYLILGKKLLGTNKHPNKQDKMKHDLELFLCKSETKRLHQ
jgi:hypothetical protein